MRREVHIVNAVAKKRASARRGEVTGVTLQW
jgi:hypothetical protein